MPRPYPPTSLATKPKIPPFNMPQHHSRSRSAAAIRPAYGEGHEDTLGSCCSEMDILPCRSKRRKAKWMFAEGRAGCSGDGDWECNWPRTGALGMPRVGGRAHPSVKCPAGPFDHSPAHNKGTQLLRPSPPSSSTLAKSASKNAPPATAMLSLAFLLHFAAANGADQARFKRQLGYLRFRNQRSKQFALDL